MISLNFTSGPYLWSDVISFINIRPNTTPSTNLYSTGMNEYGTKEFLITAFIRDSNDSGILKYVEVSGTSLKFEIGTCSEAQFTGSSN